VLKDPEVVVFLKEQGLVYEKLDFQTKWAPKTVPVFRVDVK
jgi:hypothetical protein